MWEGAGIFRTEAGLNKTLGVISHLSSLRLLARTRENLAGCCTAQNMLLSASLVVRGAILRKESRGAHMRKDVVQTWDARNSPYGHTYQSLDRSGIETAVRS
jgi:fumarate reductase (CoM/CoB) subunit A